MIKIILLDRFDYFSCLFFNVGQKSLQKISILFVVVVVVVVVDRNSVVVGVDFMILIKVIKIE